MSEVAIEVRVLEDTGHINLRGDATNKSFLTAVRSATGCALPVSPNTVTDGETRVCWLGPNEWLFVMPATNVDAARLALEQALQVCMRQLTISVADKCCCDSAGRGFVSF